MFYFDPTVSLSIPIPEIQVTDPTAERIVFIMARCGMFVSLFWVILKELPALKKSQATKIKKQPPTTKVSEWGLKPSPICKS